MQSLAERVKPGGTGRPRFAISARPAPLPPRMSRIAAEPSARPGPNEYTKRSTEGNRLQSNRRRERGRVAVGRDVLGDGGGIIAGETGVAELAGVAARGPQHAVQGEVTQRFDPEVRADLLYGVGGRDQLLPRRRVDPVVAGAGD